MPEAAFDLSARWPINQVNRKRSVASHPSNKTQSSSHSEQAPTIVKVLGDYSGQELRILRMSTWGKAKEAR